MCSEMTTKTLFPGKESRDCADDWRGGFYRATHFSSDTRFLNSARRPTVAVVTSFCSSTSSVTELVLCRVLEYPEL